jgi:hypothetical protein
VGYEVGADEVEPRRRLIADGRLTRKLAGILEPFRSEVFELNLFGSDQEKSRFVDQVNCELQDTPASLVLRRESILPRYTVPMRITNWFTVVIYHDSQRHRVAGEVGEIRTLYPGRAREPFPGGRWFFAHYGADRRSRGLEILDRLAERRPLEKRYQLNAVAAQQRAQAFWWEHVLVGSPPPDDGQARRRSASGSRDRAG